MHMFENSKGLKGLRPASDTPETEIVKNNYPGVKWKEMKKAVETVVQVFLKRRTFQITKAGLF